MGTGPRRRRSFLGVLCAFALVAFVGFVAVALARHTGGSGRRKRLEAKEEMRAGRFERARVLLLSVLDERAGDLDVRRDLIRCCLEVDRLAEAGEIARGSLEIAPSHAPAHAALSIVSWRSGDLDAAVAHARAAADGRPPLRNARLRLAELLLEVGQVSEAVEAFAREMEKADAAHAAPARLLALLRRVEPDSPAGRRAARWLGQRLQAAHGRSLPEYAGIAILAGESDAAVEALEAARAIRPLSLREGLSFSAALAALGRREEAERVLAEVEARAPDGQEPGIRPVEAARAWLLTGRADRARERAESGLETAPRDADLLRVRLAAMRATARAEGIRVPPRSFAAGILSAADDVLAVRPRDETALAARALAALSLGRPRRAFEDALALRRSAPSSARGPWLKGLALLSCGDAPSAVLLLREGREAAPSERAAARWIVRAAVRAGDGRRAAEEAARLEESDDPALLASVAVLLGDLDRAERLAGAPRDGPSEVDRRWAVLLLARAGRPGPARELAAALGDDPRPRARLWRGDLLLALGEREAAAAAYESAAAAGGPEAVAALTRLAEIALSDGDGIGEPLRRLRECPDGETAALMIEGRAAALRGDWAAAVEAARRAVAGAPQNPRSRELLLDALRGAGAPRAEVEREAERVLALAPGSRSARTVKCKVVLRGVSERLRRGEAELARSDAAELVELSDDGALGVLLRGIVASAVGDVAAAEDDARLLAREPGGGVASRYLLGLVRFRQGRLAEAVDELRAVVRTAPEAHGARAALALSLIALRRGEEAVEVADGAERAGGALELRAAARAAAGRHGEAVALLRASDRAGEPAVRLAVARILLAGGRSREAATECETLVREHPGMPRAHRMLVEALLRGGQPSRARKAAEAARATKALGVDGLLIRAHLRGRLGDRGGEGADLRRAVKEAPADPRAHRSLGRWHLRAGDRRRALRHLAKARDLSPRDVTVLLLLADLADEEGHRAEAMAYWEDVLTLDPAHVVAANNLAFALAERRMRPARAVELARMAVARVPENGELRDTLAAALAARGDLAEAAREAVEAMRLLPSDADVALRAARILGRAGRREDAIRAATTAMDLAAEAGRPSIEDAAEDLLRSLGRR
jgi:tetratricopeptide (TPR) repeat protein